MIGAQPVMAEQPYSKLKGDEKRWRAEEGANLLRRHAELMKDADWLAAAKAELKKQVEAGEKALKYAEMDGKK